MARTGDIGVRPVHEETLRPLWRALACLLTLMVVLATIVSVRMPAASASSHEAFDHFDADASGRHYTNAYLLSLLSYYIYDGEVPGATGAAFESTFEAFVNDWGLAKIDYVDVAATDTQAMVLETDDAVIVVFRGTQQAFDFVIDGMHLVADPTFDGVHPGFSLAALSALPEVTAAINSAGNKKVWLTGHSLGGALAQATAYYYAAANILDPDSAPEVHGIVTYGAPRLFRTGSIAHITYAVTYDNDHSQRWVNHLDPVPHLIFAPEWIHMSKWTIIHVDGSFACSVLFQDLHLIGIPDLADHDVPRYMTRLFWLMPLADRIGLPLPPLPGEPVAECDALAPLPPSVPTDSDGAANSIAEGAANGTSVGITGSSSDPNGDSITYSLTNSAGGRFAIDASSGVVTVANASLLNFETATSHTITIRASDGDLTASSSFIITIVNVAPSAPTDADATVNEVAEGAANGTAVGITASSTDPNGPAVSFSLTNNAGGRFAIDASTGVVTVADASLLNFEDDASHNITARASDGALSATATFTIAITDVAPSTPIDTDATANQVAEGAANGTGVGITASSFDPNGPDVAYSLTDDAGGRFAIDGTSGVVSVVATALLDGPATHDITVVASHASGSSLPQTFAITVTNVDPTASIDVLDGGLPGIALVGVPVDFAGSFSDPAIADTHTATVDWGDGSTADDFGGGDVTSPVAATHVYTAAGGYTVWFAVTDDDGGAATVSATITVYDASAAIELVLDDIDERLTSETDPVVLAALQAARDQLDGNNGGEGNNGANDLLASNDLVAALVQLGAAIASLETAEAAGGDDASDLKVLLALTAQSIAQQAFEDATAAVGPSPSKGKQKQLDKIESLIAAGIAELAAGNYGTSVERFKNAVQIATDLTA